MSFGSDLRRERETRGVGIADIAAGTKVSERHLRALEDDAIDALPGGVFNKGFVRSYCHFLALDQEAWAQRYADTFETGTTEPDWSAFAENVKRNRTATPSTGLRWWGVALMLVALAALAWGVWHLVLKHKLPGSLHVESAPGAVILSSAPATQALVRIPTFGCPARKTLSKSSA